MKRVVLGGTNTIFLRAKKCSWEARRRKDTKRSAAKADSWPRARMAQGADHGQVWPMPTGPSEDQGNGKTVWTQTKTYWWVLPYHQTLSEYKDVYERLSLIECQVRVHLLIHFFYFYFFFSEARIQLVSAVWKLVNNMREISQHIVWSREIFNTPYKCYQFTHISVR